MQKLIAFFKKEAMLCVSLLAALLSFLITPPSAALLQSIDWKTLAILFMLLSVIDGIKHENLFLPVIRLAGRFHTQLGISLFLIFGVFFSSMFVTNDVSLIIFVPLTMLLFRAGDKERYIIPTLCMENIAAVRGSLLTPFGSPQNLFLFSKSEMSAPQFMLMMLPLWLMSIALIILFELFFYRKNLKESISVTEKNTGSSQWDPARKGQRILYIGLFVLIVATIVSRTSLWPYVTLAVALLLLFFDRQVFRRVDYVLLLTFLCFFVFSSSIAANQTISEFLHRSVAGAEYWWSLLLSQVISNVPASIVLQPFTVNLKALLYGLDTAGLISIIGSLASVINMRIYLREYPGNGGKFMLAFEKICLCFFAIVVIPQWLMCR